MLIDRVRPTTLDGVKSLATQIKKERGTRYLVALDEAARAANCQNYRHALRTLPLSGRGGYEPYVLLTAYWWEHKDGYRSGRETLTVKLSKPIPAIAGKSAWNRIREFFGYRMVADDHFVSDGLYRSQDGAREGLCAAARSIGFVESTGLRPVTGSDDRHLRQYLRQDKLPGADHSTVWVDPQTDQFVVIDEPYSPGPDHSARANWAKRSGWTVMKTSWGGIYRPYECDLYVVTDGRDGYDVDALVSRINATPPPTLAAEWTEESVLSWETFVSPLATTPQDLRRARCRGMIYPADSANSVPYSYNLGTRKRRPVGEMGIPGHIEAGRIIRAVLSARHEPSGVYTRLSSLRSVLEDWMSLEMSPGDPPGPEFFDVYYNDSQAHVLYDQMASTHAGAVALLGQLKQQLLAAYSQSAPLKRQLRRIEMSMDLLGRDVQRL